MSKKKVYNAYDFADKKSNINNYIRYLLNKTTQMFEYTGLPETIDANQLELRLQTDGVLFFTDIKESDIQKQSGGDDIDLSPGIYAFSGSPAGVEDFNGNPTFTVIAHPRLKSSKTLKINEDCVMIKNDTTYSGLIPLFTKYITQLVENDITMNMADIESRIVSLIVAGDTNTIADARKFLSSIEAGKMGVITDKGLSDFAELKTLPYTTTANNSLTNLIEYHQYIKASLFNELGLTANYNMKREAINSSEASLGNDSIQTLPDNMLHCREKALEQLNKLYGTNASVKFHSGWEHEAEQIGQDEEQEEPGTEQEEDKNEQTD